MSRFKLAVFLLSLICCSVNVVSAHKNESSPLNIIIIENNHPFSFTLPDGSPAGLYVDYWKLWSEENSIPIHFTSTSLENGLNLVKEKHGVHAGLFKNEERAEWADFAHPIHSVQTGILFDPSVTTVETLDDQKNIIVATQVGSFQEKFLKKNFPNIKLSLYDGLDMGIQQLLRNDVQAVVSEIPNIKAQVARAGLSGVFTIAKTPLIKNLVYPVLAKGQQQLLSNINEGFNNIPRSMLTEIETKWLPTLKPYFNEQDFFSSLTNAENQWLKSQSSFTVGSHGNWYPYEFRGDKGEIVGITIEYINYASELLDINFRINSEESWLALLKKFQNEKIDIISAIARTPEREKTFLFTNSYIKSPTVIVIRKNSFFVSSITDLQNKKIGLIKGFALIELVKRDHPDYSIISVPSLAEGIIKLHNGEIDAFINTATSIKLEIERQAFNDLEIASISPYVFEVSMAVRKGLEPLVPILNKAMASMSDKQRSAIANNWLSVELKQGTDIKTILTWSVPIVSFLLIVILVFSHINRRLKNEISHRKQSELEQRSLEMQLHQSLKMEALGQLTSGIAHDFNNLLGIILGYSEMMKSGVTNPEKVTAFSEHIFHAGTRGAKLTKKLMSFTRKQDIESTEININELLMSQKDLLQKTLTVMITIQYDLKDHIWPVWLDGSDLQDSLLNICINAKHAMEECNRSPVLTISTNNKTLNTSEALRLGVNPGEYVELTIKDTGCGMTEAVQRRIFDPFYTTKADEGTGLGLSQVFGFARRSKSAIDVISSLNRGTQFHLYFPRYTGDRLEDASELLNNEPMLTGSETILIVDDEPLLLQLSSQILIQAGYKILIEESALAAIETLKNESVDLLLSDVIMPKMDGFQLAAFVQKKYPKLKIQLVSGFADPKNSALIDTSLLRSMIRKPYSAHILLSTIRKVLDH